MRKKTRTSWQKGQSGNPKGRPKGMTFNEELLNAFRSAAEKDRKDLAAWLVDRAKDDPKLMLKLIDKCISDAPRAVAATEAEARPLPPIVVNLNATKPTGQ